MTLLFLAAVSCLQESSAADTLKKIEEALRTARTVKIKYDFVEVKSRMFEASGTVLLKDSNKVLCTVPNQGVPGMSTFVCDGTEMKTQANQNKRRAPKNLRSFIEGNMIRGYGIYWTAIGAFELADGSVDDPEVLKGFDAGTSLPASDLALGKDDQGRAFVKFTVKRREDDAGFEITLWFDTKTYAPTKRVMKPRREGSEGKSITETFAEYSFGGEIPDDRFKLTPSE